MHITPPPRPRPGLAGRLGALVGLVAVMLGVGVAAGGADAPPAPTGTSTSTTTATAPVQAPAAPATPTVPPAPAATPGPIWGIDEQHVAFFGDPRWQQLPLRHVRYFVPWDLAQEPRYQRLADAWMAAARAHHALPLVAITQSNVRGLTHVLPSRWRYRRAVGAIMSRYRWVRSWTPWNEANLSLQSTLRHPAMAAKYWRVMLTMCTHCTVTSPSIVGYTHNAPRGWMRTFLRAARGLHGPWAIHLYNDINELHTYALTQLERELPAGQIWVTEVGGWKHFNNFPTSLAHQTRALSYLFHLAPKALPRVSRWYLYQWIGSPRGARWDSGLTYLDGQARPALRVVQRFLLPRDVAPIR